MSFVLRYEHRQNADTHAKIFKCQLPLTCFDLRKIYVDYDKEESQNLSMNRPVLADSNGTANLRISSTEISTFLLYSFFRTTTSKLVQVELRLEVHTY